LLPSAFASRAHIVVAQSPPAPIDRKSPVERRGGEREGERERELEQGRVLRRPASRIEHGAHASPSIPVRVPGLFPPAPGHRRSSTFLPAFCCRFLSSLALFSHRLTLRRAPSSPTSQSRNRGSAPATPESRRVDVHGEGSITSSRKTTPPRCASRLWILRADAASSSRLICRWGGAHPRPPGPGGDRRRAVSDRDTEICGIDRLGRSDRDTRRERERERERERPREGVRERERERVRECVRESERERVCERE
jgi:hypothetical protein